MGSSADSTNVSTPRAVQRKKRDCNNSFLLVAIICVPVLGIVLALFADDIQQLLSEDGICEGVPEIAGFNVTGFVFWEEWGDSMKPEATDEQIAYLYTHLREPVLLLDSPVLSWPAFTKWNPEYITEKVPSFVGARKQKWNDVFTYCDADQLWARLDSIQCQHEKNDMGAKRFFLCSNPETRGSERCYFSHALQHESARPDGWENVDEDISPRDFLVVGQELKENRKMRDFANVWIGGTNVTAQAHYDTVHNFYVQIVGQKQFVLSPPTQWPNLYQHPEHHISVRQSQMNFSEEFGGSQKIFPNFGKASAQIVTLEKGDVLYIPPYWFHQAKALSHEETVSMSINVWTDSVEGILLQEMTLLGLPSQLMIEDMEERPPDLMRIAALYIRTVIEKVVKSTSSIDAATFIKRVLLTTRYRPLYETLECSDDLFEPDRCPTDGTVSAETFKDIEAFTEKVANVVRVLNPDQLFKNHRSDVGVNMLAIRDLILGDYVERTMIYLIQAEKMCSFFRCLSLDTSWQFEGYATDPIDRSA